MLSSLKSTWGHDLLDGVASISAALSAAARTTPDRVYATSGEHQVTLAELDAEVDHWCRRLRRTGVESGAGVLVGLENSIEHVAIIFALGRIEAVWIPVNPRLKGDSLVHLVTNADPAFCLVRGESELCAELLSGELVSADRVAGFGQDGDSDLRCYERRNRPSELPGHGVAAIMYTSGTTGPAKGVLVTDQMLRASAMGVFEVTEPQPGDCFFVWEPLFHIGGAQVLLLPLFAEVTLALASRFSATSFWSEVASAGATHVHYLGGILSMLIRQAPNDQETGHRVRIAWGAGADDETIGVCRERFGIEVRECYGMTETSSVVTINNNGPGQGVGQPLPWFEVELADVQGSVGAIRVRGRMPGLITTGYLGNPDATNAAHEDGWWRTGDLGKWDEQGNLHFQGRGNDSMRVRGENVSAWQVESVFQGHRGIKLCAAVGIPAQVGEQDIMLLVIPAAGVQPDPEDWWALAGSRLANYQLPRWYSIVESLPMTPSQRVAKKEIVVDQTRANLSPSAIRSHQLGRGHE